MPQPEVSIRPGNGLPKSNGILILANMKVLKNLKPLTLNLLQHSSSYWRTKLNLLVTQKERALELTDGKPLRGRQILCMIIDHYQINANDKDYKNITDLNNVSLSGIDVLGSITKWDDVLMRFDKTKLTTDEQLLLLLERQSINSASFKINYTLFQNEKVDNPGSAKTTYDYLHRQIHNHTRRDRADEIAR